MALSIIAVVLVWVILWVMLVGAFKAGEYIEKYVAQQGTDWTDFLPEERRKKRRREREQKAKQTPTA
jgi:type II secretory pathway component PulL